MAGLLKRDSVLAVEESLDNPQRARRIEVCSYSESENNGEKKDNSLFDEIFEVSLKLFSCISCFRPPRPVIGEGRKLICLSSISPS